MAKSKKFRTCILSMALSAAMVCTTMSVGVFAADAGNLGITEKGLTECHTAHDEDCGYLKAVEGVACSHLNEDGTYSCAPTQNADTQEPYVCNHTDSCGYAEAVNGIICTHSCGICAPIDSGMTYTDTDNSRTDFQTKAGTTYTLEEAMAASSIKAGDTISKNAEKSKLLFVKPDWTSGTNEEQYVDEYEGYMSLDYDAKIPSVSPYDTYKYQRKEGDYYIFKAEAVTAELKTVTANGSQDVANTTELTLTFDRDISGLKVSDITLTGATAEGLTKEAGVGVYMLTISKITVADGADVTVVVKKKNVTFTVDTKTVKVFASAAFSGDISGASLELTATNDCSESNPHTVTGTSTVNTISVTGGTHYITLNNASITQDAGCAFALKSGATVNLTLTGDNTLKSSTDYAGLEVPEGATLTIMESSTGKLSTSCTGQYGAGIGGGDTNGATAGTITINGGTIVAQAEQFAAGIGGAYGGTCGTITINGGTVTASNKGNAAAIGNACQTGNGTASITINGGTVEATNTGEGAGIGNASNCEAGISINITGGTVTAHTLVGAGIGGADRDIGGADINITGGTITASVDPTRKGVAIGKATNGVAPKSLTVASDFTFKAKDSSGNYTMPTTVDSTNKKILLADNTEAKDIHGSGTSSGDQDSIITITTQPISPAAMTYGSITGSLTVEGTAENGSTVSYQWYENTTNSATGGTAVTGATSKSFTIPTTLDVGTHYYYCVLKATNCADKASDVATVTVNKANATSEMKTVSTTVSKNGQTDATATLPAKPAAATYGTITYGGTITCSNASVNGDTLTYTAPASTVGDTGTITIPVTTATNYNDYSIVVTVTSADKKAATITAAVADKTYNGVAVTQPTPTAVEKDTTTSVTLTYTYKWQKSNESGVYTDISGNTAPKDAGSYKLLIAGSSDTHAGTKEITFTISKATVTITADNKSAYVGDAVPTLTYTATGLASGDTLATVPTLTYESEPDMSKAGSVKIKASSAVAPNMDNYESAITYVDGTLTISNKSSGGSGDGGGGSTSTPTKPPSNTIYTTEGSKGTTNAVSNAVKNALSSGVSNNVNARATFKNFDFLAPDGLKAINDIVKKESAGKAVDFKMNLDQVEKGVVVSRVAVDPAALAKVMTEKLPLDVYFNPKHTKVSAVSNYFEKYFTNKVVSVVYEQKSSLPVDVEFCAKLELETTFGQDKQLYFYTYDNVKNLYNRIAAPGYYVDKNGYAHINAPLGGSIIISDQPLTKR